jgi:transposase
MAASFGLTPHEHSSGGKQRLLGISKRGDRYLRWLLIQGARSIMRFASRRNDALSRWASLLAIRRGVNIAAVALANKLARIA